MSQFLLENLQLLHTLNARRELASAALRLRLHGSSRCGGNRRSMTCKNKTCSRPYGGEAGADGSCVNKALAGKQPPVGTSEGGSDTVIHEKLRCKGAFCPPLLPCGLCLRGFGWESSTTIGGFLISAEFHLRIPGKLTGFLSVACSD